MNSFAEKEQGWLRPISKTAQLFNFEWETKFAEH
jgi:hypothetical protein